MRDDIQIGIVGGGAMAEALIAGVVQTGTVSPSCISVSEHKAMRCDELMRKYGVRAQVGAESFLPRIDVLILAVKPAAAAAAMSETAVLLKEGALVLSIVAGLPLARMEAAYPTHPVIRVMPNTPLAVGAGMSAYACGRCADADASDLAKLLLGAAGLKRETARLLGGQPLPGAAQMALASTHSPADLRAAVTSPAGTTAAGLRALERAGVRSALIEAVLAAAERSRELGRA